MPNTVDLQFYIQHRREERYLEYKCSMMWTGNDVTKVKVAKAMMAMSNLSNGGVVVVGMKELERGVWQPDGMSEQQVMSFNHDDIAQWVNDCAVPSVQFEVESFELDGNRFVIIKVREFDRIPVVCRRQKTVGGEDLRAGAVYFRSNRKHESAPISSDEDMRELIELAVDKGVAQEIKRLRELGLIPAEPQPHAEPEARESSALNYAQEREGL